MSKYQSEHTGQNVDKGIRLALLRKDLTQEEYDALKTAGQIVGGTTYRIYTDKNKTQLKAIYDGLVKIGPADLSKMQESEDLTQEEYDLKKTLGTILPGVIYKIFSDQFKVDLVKVYYGLTKLLPAEGSAIVDMTQVEYNALANSNQVQNGTIYRIYGDATKKYLMAIYDGITLVAQRGSSGNNSFPYTFPITF